MNKILPDGIWPTMITPFFKNGAIDFETVDRLTDWYIDQGADGLFAVCLSSEMYNLTLDERISLAVRVVKRTAGRVPVIASGHISKTFENQVNELKHIADTGIETVILSTNKISNNDDSVDIWKKNINRLVDALPSDIYFGLYECPVPFKKNVTIEELRFCEETGKFLFLKDTSCNLDIIKERISALNGKLKIFNANAATLFESLQDGVSGYCGIMANFHPALYKKAFIAFRDSKNDVLPLFDLISTLSLAEYQNYPINAKYHLQLSGLPVNFKTRNVNPRPFPTSQRLEIEKMHRFTECFI